MRRWICPSCNGGVNAPERPRKDDVRRWCLACSADTGRLVERTSPALARERAGARERKAARTTRTRERAREKAIEQRSIGGIDLLAEAKRIWNLPTMRELPRWRKQLPEIVIQRSRWKFTTSGHCRYGSRRIVMTVGTDTGHALEVVAHELMHAALGSEGHSARFWSRLRSVAKEAWPTATFDFPNAPSMGWALDSHIADGIRTMLKEQTDGST